jgi:putative peptidoglycan lipid II flippase
MSEERHFLRSTLLISVFTTLSRILGLVRDIACAAFFGGGMVWDAFSFAFRVPNLFRRLFGEGALSSAFIPVFTDYLENRDREDAWRLVWVVATAVGAILLACLVLGEALVLAIPLLTEVTPRWRLALALTAVLFPYMIFICLTAMAGSILQSLRHFTAPALAPVVLNICWIIAVVAVAPLVTDRMTGRIFILAVGILAAGVFQLALQLGVLSRLGLPWKPAFDLSHPGLRKIFITMLPVVMGMAAFQANVFLDGVIAISLAAPEGKETFRLFGTALPYPMQIGANSTLYYANRIMQFPLGVFGIALATAIFPTLSSRAARSDWDGFQNALTEGLGTVLFIGIPAGMGLIVLGQPGVELLFERGEFSAEMSARTAVVISAYGVGIWAYCAHHVLARAFYSLKDTVTPVKIAAGTVALNLALNLTLIWWLAAAGLAMATALSTAVQCALLYLFLVRRTGPPEEKRMLSTLLKTAIASVGMAGITMLVLGHMPPSPPGDALGMKLLRLLLPMAVGIAVYSVLAAALRIPEMDLLLGLLRRKLTRRHQ